MKKAGHRTLQIFCGGLLVMGLVWQRIEATALGYAVETSRERILHIQGENALLERQVDQAASCGRIAREASARLGMIPAPLSAERVLPVSPLENAPQSFFSSLLTRVWRRARQDARLFSS
ncbi:MAG: hypothetical protein KGL04_01040 [Elusimicrobia bacterium]|nr:hypothetical protein [Elusimicrobiota bacterium]MDE2312745.1 hypothetical protein [Elusimicrobiota bacterium]